MCVFGFRLLGRFGSFGSDRAIAAYDYPFLAQEIVAPAGGAVAGDHLGIAQLVVFFLKDYASLAGFIIGAGATGIALYFRRYEITFKNILSACWPPIAFTVGGWLIQQYVGQ